MPKPKEKTWEYNCDLVFNGLRITKFTITDHYLKKHSKVINNRLIDEIVNKNVCIIILQDQLLSFFDVLHADGITNIVFQQDNARSYIAEKTKKILDQLTKKHEFSIIIWFSNSFDMNSIE